MSRRYALARLGATLESLPELVNRFHAARERFERMRVSDGTPEQVQAAAVFDRLYGDAESAFDLAHHGEGETMAPHELIQLEDAVQRVEGAAEVYRSLTDPSTPTRPRRWTPVPLLVGIAFLGGVLFLSRSPRL